MSAGVMLLDRCCFCMYLPCRAAACSAIPMNAGRDLPPLSICVGLFISEVAVSCIVIA